MTMTGALRFACDTGGTFTDLLVEDAAGALRMVKAPTTPDDPVRGVLDSLAAAADELGLGLADLLGRGELFIHGTTHAINAIVTGRTARTAFLTTEGHPDILVFREGGRSEPFNFTVPYPEPYIPKALTFEIPERIMGDGAVRTPLDEAAVMAVIARLRDLRVEAVGVCLLWSIVNPDHEERVGRLLAEHLPGVPVTLSHRVNPSLREYRRASATCLDASLKPLMGAYMRDLEGRLRAAGFAGRVLIITSQGGVMDAATVAEAPVHLINSGPSMAPVAGRHFAALDSKAETAIVADTGGTTFDVSVVRRGHIPRTRETWIGQPFRGHMTGLPSVDVKSIGAGGGSIAWVDPAGLLHVGPDSAGAVPGPACYGRGGTRPTLSDAALVLGHIDPAYFLGGGIPLDTAAAEAAIAADVARPLGLDLHAAAAAVVALATENMVQAIMDITVNQGIDAGEAVLIGGGGAAGLNACAIGRRLGCAEVVLPDVGAALSAAGALASDLSAEYRRTFYAHTGRFDFDGVNAVLAGLAAQARAFAADAGRGARATELQFFMEARYPDQVWEIEVPLRRARFAAGDDVADLEADFNRAHEEQFAVADEGSRIEIVSWSVLVRCRLRDSELGRLAAAGGGAIRHDRRPAYFAGHGLLDAAVLEFDAMTPGERVAGPAIVESPVTTIVVDPGATCQRLPSGSLAVRPFGG
ncbi:MAG: hydantoinase/oxoprolinase family protein [Alphaproteobacteria bacterium]